MKKRRRKIKARSIEEPWSVSMWEPPQPVAKQVFVERESDEQGNETLQFKNMKVYERKRRSKGRPDQGT
jgi:hypothetical protein